MAKQSTIIFDQMDQVADQLIAQLYSFKEAVADLRNMAEVSTPALGNGVLSDAQIAALLNRREKTLAKKFH